MEVTAEAGAAAADVASRSGALSPAQIARYAAEGYLAPLEALSPDHAAANRRRLDPLLTPSRGLADARLRNDPHLILAWVAELVRTPRVLDAVESLLGPDLLVWRSVFFVKRPQDTGYVAWHQDVAYWDLSDDRAVTAWIALTDSSVANGCVRVVPGSQRGPLLDHRLARDTHNRLLRGQVAMRDVPDHATAPIELRPGQFSLHHARLLHSSPANPTDTVRAGLAVRYIPPDVRTDGPRRSALLVRGTDRCGHYDAAPLARTDYDPAGVALHARELRRYGWHTLMQILRHPTPDHLALLLRIGGRGDVLRAMLPWRRRSKRDG